MMKMTLKIKIIFKIIVFIIIFISISFTLAPVFIPKFTEGRYRVTTTVVDFYQEPDHSLDVLFLGTSVAAHAFSPLTMWGQDGIASYSLSTEQQPPIISYYLLREALRHQSPEVVVVDGSGFFNGFDFDVNKRFMRKALDFVPLSALKIEAVNEIVKGGEEQSFFIYFYQLATYHERWQDLNASDFRSAVSEYSLKGVDVCYEVLPFELTSDYYMEDDDASSAVINETGKEYLIRIIELCQEQKINLVITSLPRVTWNQSKSENLEKLCEQYEVPYIDYNLPRNRIEIGFDTRTDFYDEGYHMNALGAEKVSGNLSSYLKRNFDLPDRRNEKGYADWIEDYKNYSRQIAEFKLELGK